MDTNTPSSTPISLATSNSGLIAVLSFYGPVATLGFALFCWLRNHFPEFYEPRTRKNLEPSESAEGLRNPAYVAPLPRGLVGWFMPTLDMSDGKIYNARGPDALVYIRFLKMMIVTIAAMGFLGTFVLIPINLTAQTPEYEIDAGINSYLSNLCMSNVPRDSRRLWVHLIATYIFSLLIYLVVHRSYKGYFKIRKAWLRRDCVQSYSVWTTEMKLQSRDTIEAFFDRLFPGQVLITHRTYVHGKLVALSKEKEEVRKSLMRSRWDFETHGVRPVHREGPLPAPLNRWFGVPVDSIDFFSARLRELSESIAELQRQRVRHTGTAFVTFKSRSAALAASQLVLAKDMDAWLTEPAPDPKDVIWANLKHPAADRFVRTILVAVLVILLLFFWSIPVAFVQGLSNLSKLSHIPIFKPIINIIHMNKSLEGVVSTLLPSLALIIFNALLPDLIKLLERLRKFHTYTRQSKAILLVHFSFLVVNTLLVSAVAGITLSVAKSLVLSPVGIIKILSTTVPEQSSFFLTYIVLQGLSNFLVQIIRPKELIGYWLLKRFYVKTPEELEEAADCGTFQYSTRYAQELTIFVMALTYSVMAPAILVAALLYFCLMYVATRYNLIYAFKDHREGGGTHWPLNVHLIFSSMLLFQLTMCGVFLVFDFYGGTKHILAIILPAVLPFLTIAVWLYMHKRFYRISAYLPLALSATMKTYDVPPPGWADAYCQPEMKQQELEELEHRNSSEETEPVDERTALIDADLRDVDVYEEDDDKFN